MSQTSDYLDASVPCSVRIQSIYHSLRNSEKMVADYVLETPQDVMDLPMMKLSQHIGVSEASVIRFCKRMGYSGYSEFKIMLAKELGERGNVLMENDSIEIYADSDLESVPQKIINRSIRSLEDTLRIFSTTEYERAVYALRKAKHIVLYGVGNSASVADDAANKFLRLGMQCNVYADSHLQIMSALGLRKGDVAIGISHSGKTKETVEALRKARMAGATTICITNHEASGITDAADIKLLTAATETSYESETMASRIAQLAIIDFLYIGIMLQDFEGYRKRIGKLDESLIDKSI